MPKGPKVRRSTSGVEGGTGPSAPAEGAAPLVIGIDASLTSTGLVALGVQTGECASVGLVQPTSTGVLRLAQIRSGLKNWLAALPGPVAHIAMERYGFESQSAFSIGEGGGVVKLLLLETFEAPVCFPSLPAPNQVKKFVTGSGGTSVSKDRMRLEVYKRWGFEHTSNDAVDAYAIAQIARALVSLPQEATQFQQEVIHSMWHPPKKKRGASTPAVHAELPVHMRYELLH